MKKISMISLGVIVGAIAGYLYWNYIGCTSGTCPITSVWYRSTLYGALLGGTLGFSFFNSNKKDIDMTNHKNLEAEDFSAAIQSDIDAVVLDVRTPMEYNGGHFPGAVNIDFINGDLMDKIKTLDKSKPYYLYCRSGGRSAVAALEMTKNGFDNVFNLSHGITSLRNIEFVR